MRILDKIGDKIYDKAQDIQDAVGPSAVSKVNFPFDGYSGPPKTDLLLYAKTVNSIGVSGTTYLRSRAAVEVESWSAPTPVGNVYYVDKRVGSDSYSTTQAQNPETPWKTLRKVNSSVPTGTHTVEIASGSGPYGITDLGNLSQNSFYPQQNVGSDISYHFNGNELRVDVNVNDGSYQWQQSTDTGKESWYYLTASGGGVPQFQIWDGSTVDIPTTKTAVVNGVWSAESTNLINSPEINPRLENNNWAFGDFDSLGFSTLYVLFDGGSDPTNSSAEIWVNSVVTSLLRGGYGGSTHKFYDAVFSGAQNDIFDAAYAVEFHRCVLMNTNNGAINLNQSTLEQNSAAYYTIFLNTGHQAVGFLRQQNFDMVGSIVVNSHTIAKLFSDSAYTFTLKNTVSYNLLAGAIQQDVATPTVVESSNIFHTDPLSNHSGKAISFTTGTRYWTLTDSTSFPALTDTSLDQRTDPLMVDPVNGDFTLQSTSPAIAAGADPFSNGDGDQYDAAGYKVWSDDTDSADNHALYGWSIGAYQYPHAGGNPAKVYYHLNIDAGSSWADYQLSALKFSKLVDADDGTLFTAGTPNNIDTTARAAMGGDQFFFSSLRGMAIYNAALTGTNLTKADNYFGF